MPSLHTVRRPYIIRFRNSGNTFPLSGEEAQRVIEGHRLISAKPHWIVLCGCGGGKIDLYPATLGGGPAFEVWELQNEPA